MFVQFKEWLIKEEAILTEQINLITFQIMESISIFVESLKTDPEVARLAREIRWKSVLDAEGKLPQEAIDAGLTAQQLISNYQNNLNDLFGHIYSGIMRLIWKKIGRNNPLADDIAQDVSLELQKELTSKKSDGNFKDIDFGDLMSHVGWMVKGMVANTLEKQNSMHVPPPYINYHDEEGNVLKKRQGGSSARKSSEEPASPEENKRRGNPLDQIPGHTSVGVNPSSVAQKKEMQQRVYNCMELLRSSDEMAYKVLRKVYGLGATPGSGDRNPDYIGPMKTKDAHQWKSSGRILKTPNDARVFDPEAGKFHKQTLQDAATELGISYAEFMTLKRLGERKIQQCLSSES